MHFHIYVWAMIDGQINEIIPHDWMINGNIACNYFLHFDNSHKKDAYRQFIRQLHNSS